MFSYAWPNHQQPLVSPSICSFSPSCPNSYPAYLPNFFLLDLCFQTKFRTLVSIECESFCFDTVQMTLLLLRGIELLNWSFFIYVQFHFLWRVQKIKCEIDWRFSAGLSFRRRKKNDQFLHCNFNHQFYWCSEVIQLIVDKRRKVPWEF